MLDNHLQWTFTMNQISLSAFTLLLIFYISDGSVVKRSPFCPIVHKEKCNSQYAKFYLYTREVKSEDGEFILFYENGTSNLSQSHYNPKNPTIFIIHGYDDSYKNSMLQDIKNEYLKREACNVWMLDYEKLVPDFCYLTAAYNVEYVGRCLAQVITALGRPKEGLHVIGFSLGGHVPAAAAQELKPYKIPRVTGLDPAGPLFVMLMHKHRLSSEAGEYVDVIHANAFFQGNFLRMGHVDFFVNGGIFQPGCHGFYGLGCSHFRAMSYFIESINSKTGFWGWQCSSELRAVTRECAENQPFLVMGERLNKTDHGIIYVPTNNDAPYAKGRPHLEEKNSDDNIQVVVQ